MEGYHCRKSAGLGRTLLAVGLLAMLVGAGNLAVQSQRSYYDEVYSYYQNFYNVFVESGQSIAAGGLYVIAGGLGIGAGTNTRVGMTRGTLALAAISSVAAFGSLGVSIAALVEEIQMRYDPPGGIIQEADERNRLSTVILCCIAILLSAIAAGVSIALADLAGKVICGGKPDQTIIGVARDSDSSPGEREWEPSLKAYRYGWTLVVIALLAITIHSSNVTIQRQRNYYDKIYDYVDWYDNDFVYAGSGIWGGLMYLVAGAVGIRTTVKVGVSSLRGALAMAVIGTAAALADAGLTMAALTVDSNLVYDDSFENTPGTLAELDQDHRIVTIGLSSASLLLAGLATAMCLALAENAGKQLAQLQSRTRGQRTDTTGFEMPGHNVAGYHAALEGTKEQASYTNLTFHQGETGTPAYPQIPPQAYLNHLEAARF